MSLGARYLLISVTCFALVNLSAKSLSHLPFQQVVFVRAFISLIITFAYLKARRIPIWGSNKTLLLFRGLAGTVAVSCFFYSIHTMPLASAVTIQYLSPVFTVLFAGLFFGEHVKPVHWLSSLLGFVGVYVIEGFDPRVSLFGAAIGVLGAVSAALAYNSVRSLRDSDHEWVVIFYFPLVGSLLTLPFAAHDWIWPVGLDWPKLLVVGVMTQFGQLYLTKGYQADSASKVASINYLSVLFAVLFGSVFFNEGLPISTGLGILLILVSVALSTVKFKKEKGAV